jgi:hypothetical protein
MRLSSLVLTSAFLTGCIWQPASGTEKENTASVGLSGWASGPTVAIDLKARNYDTGALDPITSVMSTTYDLFGDGLYSWSATLTPAQLPRKYWAPTIVGGNPAGRLEITGFEGASKLYTFSDAAQDCTIDEMNDGETQPNAGLTCSDGLSTVLFDNTGVGLAAEAVTSSTIVNKTLDGVNIKVISYLSQGHTVYAAICSPLAGAGLPISIYNHGGVGGINVPDAMGNPTSVETTWCVDWAKKGWVFAMSAYRGEPLRVPATWSVAPTSWTSTGAIETNLGEVNDSMRLLAIVQAMPSVDVDHTLMWGPSHGGGVTLRAIERGARVQAAIATFPATDWVTLYNDCEATTTGDPTSPEGQFCAFVTAMLQSVTGGTPGTHAAAYHWRSPTFFASDLKLRQDVKLLLQQGILDPIVRVGQTCSFATQAGFPADTQWHVPNNLTPGSFVTGAVAGCPQVWKASARPTASWPANRYFMVYDALLHAYWGAMTADFFNFVNSLTWSPTPW